MAKEYLNIVDANDIVLGIEDRELIHKNGLLHREVHVYFVTPQKKLYFSIDPRIRIPFQTYSMRQSEDTWRSGIIMRLPRLKKRMRKPVS